MVVLAGDMNGHVGSSNAGYDGTHGGIGYGNRNADGSRAQIHRQCPKIYPKTCPKIIL